MILKKLQTLQYTIVETNLLCGIAIPFKLGLAQENIVRDPPGPTAVAKSAKTELDVFKLFFTDEMINSLVKSTNIKIQSCEENYSRERDAKLTDFIEMCAFLGLLYLAGVVQSSDVWRTDGLGVEMFRLVMGVNRL